MENRRVPLRPRAFWVVGVLMWACAVGRVAAQRAPSDPEVLPAPRSGVELKAHDPVPADGATGVVVPLLRWEPGARALFHDVYLGKDPDLGPTDLVQSRFPPSLYYHAPGLEPGTTYYWRVDEIEADGTTIHTGDVWTFTTLGQTAGNPHPVDGATSVNLETELSWLPGERTVTHEVYFGTDETAVAAGADDAFKGRQARPLYDPGLLHPGTTYYWRVDELGFDGTLHLGTVWHFTTIREGEGPFYHVDAAHGNDENSGLSPETAFATIQKGIDAAIDGSTVLVHPGVYREPINFLGKAITVRSAGDAAVIEVGDDFAVSFYLGEGPDSVLENFVVTNSFLGVFLVQSSPTIRNLTVVSNRYGIEAYAQADPDISNCILWHNSGDDLFECRVRYSCVERGAEGPGNFSLDPLFAHPDAGDYHLRSWRGRYWPAHDVWVLDKVTSPCIDAGDPASDFAAEPSPNGGRINMGAYGGTAYASLMEGPGANRPPYVTITAPPDGARLIGFAAIRAETSDTDGSVVKVEFYVDGDWIGEDTDPTGGWTIDWSDGTPGEHEIVAWATDDDGATARSEPVLVTFTSSRRR